MIPKRIFTIWLDENRKPPELVRRCIESQKIEGYEHRLITLENCYKDSPYMQQCLTSPHLKKRYCKASDYLRMHYLLTEGGIYLDADVEMLPGKNFDALLDCKAFVGTETYTGKQSELSVIGPKSSGEFIKAWLANAGKKWGEAIPFLGSAVVGAERDSPLIEKWLARVESNFRGDDDKNFESSMSILNDLAYNEGEEVSILDADYFFSYCHLTETVSITERTICYHHFMKSWT